MKIYALNVRMSVKYLGWVMHTTIALRCFSLNSPFYLHFFALGNMADRAPQKQEKIERAFLNETSL